MLDIVIVVLCLLAFYRGWSKGLVAAVVSLLGVIVGAIFSMKMSQSLAQYLLENNIVSSKFVLPVAFLIIFVAIMLLSRLLIKSIEGVLKLAMLGWANNLIGAVLYCFFTLFIISSFLLLGNKVNIIEAATKAESKAYSYVEPIAPTIIESSSTYLPFCNKILQDITALGDRVK